MHLEATQYARVVELVDTLALGASASGREGSSPFSRTKVKRPSKDGRFTLFFAVEDLVLHANLL